MTNKANKALLRAVLEPRKPGALQAIVDACKAGADPNSICPETSTSTGRVRGGSTLLTHSIDAWASNAVRKLLECGADPSLADENGWTPWMASTLVDESKRGKIQALLEEYGADQRGVHIGQLARVIVDGDVEQATGLLQSDNDLEVLSTFRVDLVGHQIGSGNTPMLEFLLAHGMTPTSTNFLNTIRNNNSAALEVLLRFGMAPERPDENETPLMVAAGMGQMDAVQCLVEAGADPNRHADGESDWTPSFYARQAGHEEIAEWLTARMSDVVLKKQDERDASRDPKYRLLYAQATASESLSTDDIVDVLGKWDAAYGVSIGDADGCSLNIQFSAVPDNLDDFYGEIVNLCPDAAEHKRALLKELAENRKLFLWWD